MKSLIIPDRKSLFTTLRALAGVGLAVLVLTTVVVCRSPAPEDPADRSPIPFASVPATPVFEPSIAKDQIGVFVAGGLINTFNDPFLHHAKAGDRLEISLSGQSRRQPVFGIRLVEKPTASFSDKDLEFTAGGRLLQPIGSALEGNPEIRQWVWFLRDIPGPYRLTILRPCQISIGWGDGEVTWYLLPSKPKLAAATPAIPEPDHP